MTEPKSTSKPQQKIVYLRQHGFQPRKARIHLTGYPANDNGSGPSGPVSPAVHLDTSRRVRVLKAHEALECMGRPWYPAFARLSYEPDDRPWVGCSDLAAQVCKPVALQHLDNRGQSTGGLDLLARLSPRHPLLQRLYKLTARCLHEIECAPLAALLIVPAVQVAVELGGQDSAQSLTRDRASVTMSATRPVGGTEEAPRARGGVEAVDPQSVSVASFRLRAPAEGEQLGHLVQDSDGVHLGGLPRAQPGGIPAALFEHREPFVLQGNGMGVRSLGPCGDAQVREVLLAHAGRTGAHDRVEHALAFPARDIGERLAHAGPHDHIGFVSQRHGVSSLAKVAEKSVEEPSHVIDAERSDDGENEGRKWCSHDRLEHPSRLQSSERDDSRDEDTDETCLRQGVCERPVKPVLGHHGHEQAQRHEGEGHRPGEGLEGRELVEHGSPPLRQRAVDVVGEITGAITGQKYAQENQAEGDHSVRPQVRLGNTFTRVTEPSEEPCTQLGQHLDLSVVEHGDLHVCTTLARQGRVQLGAVVRLDDRQGAPDGVDPIGWNAARQRREAA